MAVPGAWPGARGAELSDSSPEPPSPSSSRPPQSDSSPSPTETTPTSHGRGPGGGARARPAPPNLGGVGGERPLALFEEELSVRPRVPALLRRMAPYSALSPDSDCGSARRSLGTLRGVLAPSLQSLLGLVLLLRLPWVVGQGGVLGTAAIGALMGTCMLLTAVSLSAVATNGLDPGGGALSLLSGALGPEAGGAVGLCGFLSAAFGAAAAALGGAELLMVYLSPGGAELGGRGRWGRLNMGRGYGAGLLALLGAGSVAPPRLRAVATPLGPAGLLLALLALQAGTLRRALRPEHALCLPPQTGQPLPPCAPPAPQNASPGLRGALPALPRPSAALLARNLWPRPPEAGQGAGPEPEVGGADASFGALLGLSLPAASGVLWGCSRCAELGDVSRSVPVGSVGAATATALSYLSAALLLGAGVEGTLLRDKFGAALAGVPVAAAAAWPGPWLPLLGAGLSAGGAGLQAMVGGARMLRALGRSRALPLPRALSRGRFGPSLATVTTAALGVLLGSLDLLAPVLSVMCLTSYLGLNLACALQGLLPTPGWSPRCPWYHWSLSLAGATLCLSLMFVTCWHCALLALGIGATAYKYLEFRSAQSEWGEGLRGLSLSAARLALLRLEDGRPPPPSLRPQLLVLSKPRCPPGPPPPAGAVGSGRRSCWCCPSPGAPPAPPPRPELLVLAAQLQGGGRGLTVLGAWLSGALPQDLPRARQTEKALRAALSRAGARGFVQVLVTSERGAGLAALVQGAGLGALRPNAVLLGWPRTWRARADPGGSAREFVELLRAAGSAGRALLVSKGGPVPGVSPGVSPAGVSPGVSPGMSPGLSLDVWWFVGTGRLLTLLPLLLRQHPVWRGCPLRLFTVALLEDNSERLRRLLEAVARRRALPAQVEVVELHDSAVSEYTYERTLMMEQRSQMLRQLRRAQGGPAPSQPPSAEEEEGGGGETRRGPSAANVRRMHAAVILVYISLYWFISVYSGPYWSILVYTGLYQSILVYTGIYQSVLVYISLYSFILVCTGLYQSILVHTGPYWFILVRANVRRMHAAERLNAAILGRSGGAGLVLLDLPPPPPPRPRRPMENYLEFLEVLTEGLGPVLLVRDGDGEGDQYGTGSTGSTGNGTGEP
nr:LOW QUALITY PROTEIN: solute carrier family 12 member 6-like [Taeniopygia guttata]